MSPLKIIVIGGGVGGPAAAIGFAQNGHDVTLYERSSHTSEVGFSFRITANSERCLQALGIDAEAGGAVSSNVTRMLDANGKTIREMRENAGSTRGTSVFAFRPQLNQQLMKAAKQSGVKIVIGKNVTKVDIEATSIEIEGAEKVFADLIIAADGVNSIVRPQIVDATRYYPKPATGHNAFRFVLPKEVLLKDELMSQMIDENAHMFSWAAPSKRILAYPVDYDNQFNVVCTHPQEESDTQNQNQKSSEADAYNQKVPFSTVKAIYSNFEPRARRILELADPDGFRVWKLVDLEDLPRWSSRRTALMGDAAHTVEPFCFSGASMAIEDALTLSTLFEKEVDTGDTAEIEKRLALYQRIREPRIRRVRAAGRTIGTTRDEDMTDFVPEYMAFLQGHDAIAYTKEMMAKEL